MGCFVCWEPEDVAWGVVKALPFVAATGAAAYFYYKALSLKDERQVNVLKRTPQVTTVTIDEIGDQACFCRCWRSSKFPYCDGAHKKHCEETGDCVGPLVVKKKK